MKRHAQRGSSLPEMAIAAGCLLLLMFGIVDFGRAMYTYGFVAQLARQGARYWIVRGTTSCTNSNSQLANCNATTAQIQSYVQSLSEGLTTPSNITVTPTKVSCPNSGGALPTAAPGCTISVTVSYPFKFMTGILPSAAITMSSTSTMVVAQ